MVQRHNPSLRRRVMIGTLLTAILQKGSTNQSNPLHQWNRRTTRSATDTRRSRVPRRQDPIRWENSKESDNRRGHR